MAIPTRKPKVEPAPMDSLGNKPVTNLLGKQLAKLIGNHTAAQIELSWKGSRPVEEHYDIHYQAGKAILELCEFCKNELGIILEGEHDDTN